MNSTFFKRISLNPTPRTTIPFSSVMSFISTSKIRIVPFSNSNYYFFIFVSDYWDVIKWWVTSTEWVLSTEYWCDDDGDEITTCSRLIAVLSSRPIPECLGVGHLVGVMRWPEPVNRTSGEWYQIVELIMVERWTKNQVELNVAVSLLFSDVMLSLHRRH